MIVHLSLSTPACGCDMGMWKKELKELAIIFFLFLGLWLCLDNHLNHGKQFCKHHNHNHMFIAINISYNNY